MIEYEGVQIEWLGHDGFRLRNGKTIYLDPFKPKGALVSADLVFITHDHQDHLSPDVLKKLLTDDTVAIAPEHCTDKLDDVGFKEVVSVEVGDELERMGVGVEVVPAYNVDKYNDEGELFHPREYGGVGFIITLDGVRIYHAGDTDVIDEMEEIETDVALLPVSGTYVMTPDEATEAVDRIQPKLAIPMHYGTIVGTPDNASRFEWLASCDVEILQTPK